MVSVDGVAMMSDSHELAPRATAGMLSAREQLLKDLMADANSPLDHASNAADKPGGGAREGVGVGDQAAYMRAEGGAELEAAAGGDDECKEGSDTRNQHLKMWQQLQYQQPSDGAEEVGNLEAALEEEEEASLTQRGDTRGCLVEVPGEAGEGGMQGEKGLSSSSSRDISLVTIQDKDSMVGLASGEPLADAC